MLCPQLRLNNVDNIGVYSELILGIQQMSMMIDLTLMVKLSALYTIEERGGSTTVQIQERIEKY